MPLRKGVDMRSRILAVAAALVLPLTFIGCSDDDSSSTVPDDVKTVLDTYSQAWSDYDSEAFLAVVTDDYRHISENGEFDAAAQAGAIQTSRSFNFTAETQGDQIGNGDGPYYVAQSDLLKGGGFPDDGVVGISTITVVDDDGTLKVSEHVFIGALP
jgi:hypothetical protein